MANRDNFLEDLKVEKPSQQPSQRFTSKAGTLSKHKFKIAAGLMALLAPLIISGCSGHVNTPTTQTPPSTTIDNSSKPLSDKSSILQDFKQRYIDEYNKVNGTDLHTGSIELHMPVQPILYKTFDGQYVTHGVYPEGTQKVLNNYGGYTVVSDWIKDDIDVIQITRNGKPLETVASFSEETTHDSVLTTVLSGNELNSLPEHLENKDGLRGNTLLEYYDLADITMKLYNSYDQNSINHYIGKYNKAIHEMDNPTTSFEKE